ncbi:hypothetical protein VTN00DRAFT_184 [Thermoascus crustaceus]|uniref:uncharacterized protein n=1 Tax=Thermoascus crustaceus TaxID=5088 RepID=UPI003743C6AB
MEQHVEGLLFWESCIPRNSPTSLVYACGFVCEGPQLQAHTGTSGCTPYVKPAQNPHTPPTPTPLQIPQDNSHLPDQAPCMTPNGYALILVPAVRHGETAIGPSALRARFTPYGDRVGDPSDLSAFLENHLPSECQHSVQTSQGPTRLYAGIAVAKDDIALKSSKEKEITKQHAVFDPFVVAAGR